MNLKHNNGSSLQPMNENYSPIEQYVVKTAPLNWLNQKGRTPVISGSNSFCFVNSKINYDVFLPCEVGLTFQRTCPSSCLTSLSRPSFSFAPAPDWVSSRCCSRRASTSRDKMFCSAETFKNKSNKKKWIVLNGYKQFDESYKL